MARYSARNLIASLARDEAALQGQEFLAPLCHVARARLRIRGLVYELQVKGSVPGWWICRVHNIRQATIVTEALPWQRGEYLALWPTLRLVLLEPLAHGDWSAL